MQVFPTRSEVLGKHREQRRCKEIGKKKLQSGQYNGANLSAVEAGRKIRLQQRIEITLAHFDPLLPVILETDASNRGIGGVISHIIGSGQERPIAFYSRTLTPAEINYPTIQKEALAIVESTKKFFDYLIGRKFVLRTDHKPLIAIFGDKKGVPTIAAARMQRWAQFLMAFDYSIEHQSGVDNPEADLLSRWPKTNDSDISVLNSRIRENIYINFIAEKGIQLNHHAIKLATMKDIVLAKIHEAVQNGTIESLKGEEFKPLVRRSSELSTESGVVMWGHRVIVPSKFRHEALANITCFSHGHGKVQSHGTTVYVVASNRRRH